MTAGSNPDLWGSTSTYQAVAYDALPPIEGLDGTVAWLTRAPEVAHPLVLDGEHVDERLQTRGRGPQRRTDHPRYVRPLPDLLTYPPAELSGCQAATA